MTHILEFDHRKKSLELTITGLSGVINELKNQTQQNSWLEDKGSDNRIFNNNIGVLKKLRKKADYENVGIDFVISSSSIDLSKQTTNILKAVK